MRTNKEEPDHFGHEQFHALRKSDVSRWVNLRDLNKLLRYSKSGEDGKAVLDLGELGYEKLLGSGRVDAVFTIKVKQASKSAKDKITEAGGEVLTLNELNKE